MQNRQGIQAAVKFSRGDTVYTYKSVLADLVPGEIVAVPKSGGFTMAAVVAVDKTPVTVTDGNIVISIRECDVDPVTITPMMRNDYKELIRKMKHPSFFDIGIPYEPGAEDTHAVSVRFMNDFTGQFSEQEYTYLTSIADLTVGELVVVPAGPFNLAKRASVVRYIKLAGKPGFPLKKVLCRPADMLRSHG